MTRVVKEPCELIENPLYKINIGQTVYFFIYLQAEDSRISTTQTSDSETEHSDSDIDIVGEPNYAQHYGNSGT